MKEPTKPGSHVALFRGINVGTAKRIAMGDLRELLEGLGYSDVRTLLNSGNVVFSTRAAPDKAAARIQKAVAETLGVVSRVTVITAAEVAAIVARNPHAGITDNPSRLLVYVLAEDADIGRLAPLLKQSWAPDALATGKRAAYLWCANGISQSKLVVTVDKLYRDGATGRNWATMLKLHALTGGSA